MRYISIWYDRDFASDTTQEGEHVNLHLGVILDSSIFLFFLPYIAIDNTSLRN
jgi:hypothetical protein